MAIRPKVGGFPYLAETLRRAGVIRNFWYLPSCQSAYITELGPIVSIGSPIVEGMAEVPPFDKDALVQTLRTDQAGESTFPEFLRSTWKAGIVSYDVDFATRTCTYYGISGEKFVETYPEVELPNEETREDTANK